MSIKKIVVPWYVLLESAKMLMKLVWQLETWIIF